MKYVGATNGFIRTPFMIEGIIIGLMAGVISILLVGGIYNLIANKIMTVFFALLIFLLVFVLFNDIYVLIQPLFAK